MRFPFDIESPYFLAPMAGYTDKPFRRLCREFGCGLTVSELISVNALCYDNKKTFKLIERDISDTPYCIQLFGSDPELFVSAAKKIEGFCDCIDINAGCPAPKVLKNKAGSYLLKEPDRLFEIVKALKRNIDKPISVKMRMGFDRPNDISLYLKLQDLGVDFITIHARLKNQFFKGEPDYEHIAMVRDALEIPVVANGGIDSFLKLEKVKRLTGCEFFMIGQAAIGKPYIFEDFLNKQDSKRSLKEIKRIMKRHLIYMEEFWKDKAVVKFRKFFHAYLKGYPNVKKFNNMINHAESLDEAFDIIDMVQ